VFWQAPPTYAQGLSHGVAIVERALGCFGDCAYYDIEIHADGRVIWNGRANVDAKGIKKTRVDPITIGKLFEEFFHSSEREICIGRDGIDGPSYMVFFSRGGEAEKLRAQSIGLYRLSQVWASFWEIGFPCTIYDRFDDVIARLERAVNSHQWMHGRESILDRHKLGEDIQIGTKPGFTPLMRAAGGWEDDDVERVARLVQTEPVDATDQTGWTALMVAASSCNQSVIDTLLSAGVNSNAQDYNEDTALTAAATAGCRVGSDGSIARYSLMKRLIDAGASVNHANRSGATALMVAAQFGYPESMKALLDAGAQPNLRDRRGDDVKDYANKLAGQVRLWGESSEREEYEKRLQEVLAVLAANR
jgi:hypothetical protein